MNAVSSVVAVSFVLAAGGCQQGKRSEENQKKAETPAAPQAPAPQARSAPVLPLPSAMDPATVKLEPHQLDAIGLSFATMAGVERYEGTMGPASYSMQDKRPVALAVWYGEGRTYDTWRSRVPSSSNLVEETEIEVCGQKARRGVVTAPGSKVRAGSAGHAMAPEMLADMPGGPPPPPPSGEALAPAADATSMRQIPAKTMVVVGFESKKTPVLATWTVETDRRDAFRAQEEAFFASLRCQ